MVTATSVLSRAEWRARETAHAEHADRLTAARRERAARGATHPVDDFLYTYYSYKPAILRRWHPGAGTILAEAPERSSWRWYRETADGVTVDAIDFRREKATLRRAIAGILRATAGREARFGCFGLHEWAMVYRDQRTRHEVPLRLGAAGTDAVVDAHDLRCTHFDAFRFFTADAGPRNADALSRETQSAHEQPGCLHANMDLYKWAVKLGPLVPGELLIEAFVLARDIRVIDMRASPYDLRDWGFDPITVETYAGKRMYAEAQRSFAERAEPIRRALLDIATQE